MAFPKLVLGVRKNVSILDFKALCIDINLKWLFHIRIKLTKAACHLCHTFNWRFVLDRVPGYSDRPPHCLPSQIPLYNRFDTLSCMDDDEGSCDVVKIRCSCFFQYLKTQKLLLYLA